MIAGPAYSDAAEPVSTKMPAPMIAPIPSVTRFTGPRARFRLCSPVSPASFNSESIDFVANKGLPMQLLLYPVLLYFQNPLGSHPARCFRPCRCRALARPAQSLKKINSSASNYAVFPVFLDHNQYTGTPNKTITIPMPAVWVSYSNSTPIIPTAATIYNSGSNGYPKALYGLSASGRFIRNTKIPAIVSA